MPTTSQAVSLSVLLSSTSWLLVFLLGVQVRAQRYCFLWSFFSPAFALGIIGNFSFVDVTLFTAGSTTKHFL